jgi:hypothetical protein
MHKRSIPHRHGLSSTFLGFLLPYLLISCRNSGRSMDADTTLLDVAPDLFTPSDASSEKLSLPKPDVRIGLAGGTSCEVSSQCLSNACTLGFCSDWAHAMQIGINTSAAGANVKQAISDFPLLVRLNATTFVFSEARPKGADIRFMDSSGKNLSFEIERWDVDGRVADIWVLVPRIEGDSRQNYIYMYWGNQYAVPFSEGPSVFGNFANVLHLTPVQATAVLSLEDTSGQGNNGCFQENSPSPTFIDGIAGKGLLLPNDSKICLATSNPKEAPRVFSISLWFNTETTLGGGIVLFASTKFGNSGKYDRVVWMDPYGHLSFGVFKSNSLIPVSSLGRYNDGEWHLLVARISSSGQYLFVDGESVADDIATSSFDLIFKEGHWRFGEGPVTSDSQFIQGPGAQPAKSNFLTGAIDEARVFLGEHSDAWIKLSFATQRPGATAVSYTGL